MTENVESGSGGGVGAGAEQPISRDARKWAMICHIIALVGLLGNLIGFFVGRVMQESGGRADPKRVQALIRVRLG